MPVYFDDVSTDYVAKSQTADAPADHSFATEYAAGLDRGRTATIAMTLGGGILDLADTAASSVGLTDRQEINNSFLSAVGSPGVQAWFNENRGAVEVASGVGGIVVADFVAGRVLKPASAVMRAIRKVPYAGTIATLDRKYEQAVRLAKITTKENALRGSFGIERFNSNPINFAALGRGGLTTSNSAAARGVFNREIARGLARNATTEAIMAVGLNTNRFLFEEELSANIGAGLFGLGLGATFDSMIAGRTLRQIANADEIRRINARSLDVTGLEADRLRATDLADGVLKEAFGESGAYGLSGSSALTDNITSRMIAASELKVARGTSERARALFRNREAAATPQMKIAFEDLNKVTTRGITGVPGSNFDTGIKELANPLKEGLERDPTSLYNVTEIGRVPNNSDLVEVPNLRLNSINLKLADSQRLVEQGYYMKGKKKIPLENSEIEALQRTVKDLEGKKSEIPVAMLNPGEFVPMEFAKFATGLDNVIPKVEGGLGRDDLRVWQRPKQQGQKSATLGFSSNGDLFLPKGKKLENLNPKDMFALYQMGYHAIQDFKQTGKQLVVQENAPWFVLDMASELLRATDDPSSVRFMGTLTAERAQVESLAQKVDALKRTRKNLDEVEFYEKKAYFNLPRITSHQASQIREGADPMEQLVQGFKSGDQVRQMSYAEINRALNDLRKIQGFTDETGDLLKSADGSSFRSMLDRDGNRIQPAVAYLRPSKPFEWSRDDLFVRQTMHHVKMHEELIGSGADPLTRELASMILNNPHRELVRNVGEIADDQTRSFVPGFRTAAPQETRKALLNSVASGNRIAVDAPNLRAASQLQEQVTRVTAAQMRATIDTHMGDVVSRLNSPRAARSKFLINQFHSHRPGWELLESTADVTLPDGTVGKAFLLNHNSKANQARFLQTHGRELKKGQKLLSPTGTEMVLDDLAFETLNRLQGVHETRRAAKNTLLRSQGLPEIRRQLWHVEPPSEKGKFVAYTFDANDSLVVGSKLIANTPEELSRLIAAADKDLKPGQTIRQKDKIRSFMTLWDKAQMEFIAPNTTAVQPGKRNLGTSVSQQFNPQAFDEALVSMRDNMLDHGQDVLKVLHAEPIRAAKIRAAVARTESQAGGNSLKHGSNHDRYLQNLLGTSAQNVEGAFFGEFAQRAEVRINQLLATRAGTKPTKSNVFEAEKEFMANTSPKDPVKGEAFERLAKELGPYMPFKSALEYTERMTNTKTPREIAEISDKISWFEATSRLRWFESAHGVVNLGSVVANIPSIIKSLQPKLGETAMDAANRNSSLAMRLVSPGGKEMVVPHWGKLLWNAQKNMRRPPEKYAKLIKMAERNGEMTQEVAEFHRQMDSIQGREGWKAVLLGNPNADKSTFRGRLEARGGLDYYLGYLTDKSENLSRQWAMHAGFIVADSMGLLAHSDEAALSLATEIANKTIADYNPKNRPEVFQGALGAPIGLFQSYVYNFYERMFRYIETKDARALATQAATQSAMFGVESVPGWEAVNSFLFNDTPEGEHDAIDSMYKRFGTDTGDLFMFGGLANLPQMVGLEGSSIFTRGDVEFRVPVNPVAAVGDLIGLTNTGHGAQIPIADTVKRAITGVLQAGDTLWSEGKMSGQQAAEIMSNMMTNRPLQGMLELGAANGYDTSWDGQVVSRATSMTEKAYRVLGLRTLRQQKEINEFFNDKNSETEQSARQAVLRSVSRSAIREGRYDDLPGLFLKYLETGGSPGYRTQWYNNLFESALDSRGERLLQEALSNQANKANATIAAMLDAQVDISEDDLNDSDYGRAEEIQRLSEQDYEGNPEIGSEQGF